MFVLDLGVPPSSVRQGFLYGWSKPSPVISLGTVKESPSTSGGEGISRHSVPGSETAGSVRGISSLQGNREPLSENARRFLEQIERAMRSGNW